MTFAAIFLALIASTGFTMGIASAVDGLKDDKINWSRMGPGILLVWFGGCTGLLAVLLVLKDAGII